MTSGLIEFELWTKGGLPRRDVVGESFHADAIRALFPRQLPEGGLELTLRADLLPEPANPHDRNAVKGAGRWSTGVEPPAYD